MTTREGFEGWASTYFQREGFKAFFTTRHEDGAYVDETIEELWCAWLAATKAERERCVLKARHVILANNVNGGWVCSPKQLTNRIDAAIREHGGEDGAERRHTE